MRSVIILMVISIHLLLIKSLLDSNMIQMSDLSSEGLTKWHTNSKTAQIPRRPSSHQKERVIAVIDSQWIFPNITEPLAELNPEPKSQPIAESPPVTESLPEKIKPQTNKSEQAQAAQNSHGTGQGKRASLGKGTGKNNVDGPSGFADGNAEQFILKNVDKCYPMISRQRGEEGVATLRIYVDQLGNVTHVELLKPTSFSRLNKCAMTAVKDIKVKPKVVNSQPTSSYFDKAIRFQLK